MLFLGLDGGGTKTRAVALDGEGRVMGDRVYPPAYLPGQGEEGVRQVLRRILEDLPERPAGAVLGLGGFGEARSWDEAYWQVAREVLGDNLRLMNDVELAWWAAFGGEDGVVVIAGTGSMAYGKGPKGTGRIGGFGPLFGDEGSAYWIGLEALRMASKAQDGRVPPTALRGLPQLYGKGDLLELLAFLQEEPALLRFRVAALAAEVDRLATRDWAARDVLLRAAQELHLMASALAHRLGVGRVAPMGGVFRSPLVREFFSHRLTSEGLQVESPRAEPALVAARMAKDSFGRGERI